MEESCTALALRNLPLAGRPTGNCVFLHHYYWKTKPRIGHSIWNDGKLALVCADSWVTPFIQLSPTECKGPYEITRMKQLATFAFGHVVTALTNKNWAELIVGVQTMYACQIINGAAHLPVRPHIIARAYTTPPYIIEITR